MAKDTPPDPSQQFSEWITQWERSVDEFSNKMMGTDEFSRSLNQMQAAQLEFQRRFGELMSTHLANMNMPSRDEVMRISEDITGLDRRLDRIERTLKQILQTSESASSRKKGPARTKKPPSAETAS